MDELCEICGVRLVSLTTKYIEEHKFCVTCYVDFVQVHVKNALVMVVRRYGDTTCPEWDILQRRRANGQSYGEAETLSQAYTRYRKGVDLAVERAD